MHRLSRRGFQRPGDDTHRDGADKAELPDLADDGVRLPGADGDLFVAALRVVAVEEAAVRVHHALAEAPAMVSWQSIAVGPGSVQSAGELTA